MPRHDVTSWIRAGAVGFALLAAVATALEVGREGSNLEGSPASVAARDPLAVELERCNAVTPASGRDDACERAWAENRRRFLGARRITPDITASSPAHPIPAGDRP
jgi:conjugative transfer region protein TrbK